MISHTSISSTTMLPRITHASRRLTRHFIPRSAFQPRQCSSSSARSSLHIARLPASRYNNSLSQRRALAPSILSYHQPQKAFTTTPSRLASPQPADAIVETLTDLYGTARDEFEIAAEETEKKTVYAADDRDAAREAFADLKNAFEEAVRVSDPETGKEVQGRVGQRVRELENALTALEESAMED